MLDDILAKIETCKVVEFQDEALYSVCFGGYDSFTSPKICGNVPCYMFTDKLPKKPAPGWRYRIVNTEGVPPQVAQRAFKCLSHKLFPCTSTTYYCDSSFLFLRDVTEFLRQQFGGVFSTCRHSSRNDIFQEAEACILQGKGDRERLRKQILSYRDSGFKGGNLYETGIIGRKNIQEDVRYLNEKWITEIIHHSVRDQVSLPFVEWFSSIDIDAVDINIFYNNYMVPQPHKHAPVHAKLKRRIAYLFFQAGILQK